VLRVNGEIATLRDYEERKRDRIDQIAQSPDLSLDERRQLVADAGKAVLKDIYDELLVVSRARQMHIEVTPAQVDHAVENAKSRFGIESDADFAQALAQSGLTMEEFRQRATRSILINTVFEREVQDKIKIDDEDVAHYWHEHSGEFMSPEARRIEEVVVRDDGGLDAAAQRALAEAVAARAAAGGSLADAVSAAGGSATATMSIDHGWVEAGTLAPELERAAWALPAGGVSAPVAGRGGLHVLRVVEIRAAAPRSFDEVKDEIRARLNEEKFNERMRAFLDEQAASAFIVENLPADALGYRDAAPTASDPLRDLMRGSAATPSKGERPGSEAPPPPAAETPGAPAPPPPAASEPPPAPGG
jgi:parvulin-like peptidyl-prolyl isomerase